MAGRGRRRGGERAQPRRAPAQPAPTVRIPTGKVALVLLGLCGQHPRPELVGAAGGWAWWRWDALTGGAGQVGLRTPDNPDYGPLDALAAAALARAARDHRAYLELAAFMVCFATLDGVEGGWCLERVAELVWGPGGRRAHRERQLPALRAWMALFERGHWQLEAPVAARAGRGRRATADPVASYGGRVEAGPLLSIEGGGHRRTLRLAPELAPALTWPHVVVPAATLRLRPADLPAAEAANPEGNRPSLALRARLRVAAAVAGRWRSATGQPLRIAELATRFAGVDLGPLARRRRLRTFCDVVVADLRRAAAGAGTGLAALPAQAPRALETLLRLVSGVAAPSGVARAP